jgi:hypothetical protein
MSEETNESNTQADSTSGFTPPASQDELNKIISERVARERAKFADYTDLKGKAAKFDCHRRQLHPITPTSER